MGKRRNGFCWIFIVIILVLTLLRYSGRLLPLSTYRDIFIVLLSGFLFVGLLIYVYKYLLNR